TALQQPHSVVLTKKTADKYFGNEDPIGKMLAFDNNTNLYKVTGVIHELPSNSHFHFDMFGSMSSWDQAKSDSWMYGSFYTYLLLKPGTDIKKMEARFPSMVKKYMGPQVQQAMGLSLEQFRTKGNELTFALQPLTEIHLHPETTTEMEPGGSA